MMKKHKILLLVLALALGGGAMFLIPPPISGQWRFFIPSSDGEPMWADLEFIKGNVILISAGQLNFDIKPTVGCYSNLGNNIYSYKDVHVSGTFRPGWFRATIELDEAPGSYVMLKRNFGTE